MPGSLLNNIVLPSNPPTHTRHTTHTHREHNNSTTSVTHNASEEEEEGQEITICTKSKVHALSIFIIT